MRRPSMSFHSGIHSARRRRLFVAAAAAAAIVTIVAVGPTHSAIVHHVGSSWVDAGVEAVEKNV